MDRSDYGRNGTGEIACQIYPRQVGNWTRKINHSCDPNTELCSLRVSGYWRVGFRVIRNIYSGWEITVSYGVNYWKGNVAGCLCGSENCINQRRAAKRVRET